jgi:hypothetical protein
MPEQKNAEKCLTGFNAVFDIVYTIFDSINAVLSTVCQRIVNRKMPSFSIPAFV